MVVPASTPKIEGQVKYYESKADSGDNFTRGFCPECGAPLFGKSTGDPRLAMVAAGMSRRPEPVSTDIGFFTSSRRAWDHMNPKLPKFPNMPIQISPG